MIAILERLRNRPPIDFAVLQTVAGAVQANPAGPGTPSW